MYGIAICKKYGKKAVLELKNLFAPADIARVVEELKRLEYLEGTVFISFQWDNCAELRRLLPDHKIQYLLGSAGVSEASLQKMIEHRMDLDVRGDTLTKEIVDRMQKRVITMKRGVVVSDEKGGYLHED